MNSGGDGERGYIFYLCVFFCIAKAAWWYGCMTDCLRRDKRYCKNLIQGRIRVDENTDNVASDKHQL